MQALGRQRHEPPRHRAARRRPLVHLGRYRVQRARVTARRHPSGDRGQRVLVQRVGRCRPLEARQRDFTLGAAYAHPRYLDLTAAERHMAVDTPAAPRGPLDLVAPLRATQGFPIRLHHRLQDLQTGRDAQAMESLPDTVDHAEHRQGHLNRDGLRAGGLAGLLPPVMLRHGWLSSFLNAPLSYHRTGARSRHPLHLKFNSLRDIPQSGRGQRGAERPGPGVSTCRCLPRRPISTSSRRLAQSWTCPPGGRAARWGPHPGPRLVVTDPGSVVLDRKGYGKALQCPRAGRG